MEPTQYKAPIGLKLIAAAKMAQGLALAGIAIGLFELIHRDLDSVVRDFIQIIRISPERHFAALLLEKAGLVQPSTILQAGIATSIYAALILCEGISLWYNAWWAEYLMIVSTALFIPEEFLAVHRHFSYLKLGVFISNIMMLVYITHIVLNKHATHKRLIKEQNGPTFTEKQLYLAKDALIEATKPYPQYSGVEIADNYLRLYTKDPAAADPLALTEIKGVPIKRISLNVLPEEA